ncbi:MAG: flagellar hook-basal body complex protein FliE [Oscillospiraceae bacterium]|nr:flagellar hook-basal body complex protein FliE [Oscillospiraceae bacterium]
MNTIQPLWDSMPLDGKAGRVTDTGAGGNPFTDIFQSAVDAVKETDAEKTQLEYLMATGQLDNPALLTIASTKAQLSVDLLVQLRNKAMDSYNELMRISL